MMDGNKKEYSLNFWEGAKADIESLDGSQLIFLRKGLKRIKKMGLRIIFGQDPETAEINIIDIVAVGKRKILKYTNQQKIE